MAIFLNTLFVLLIFQLSAHTPRLLIALGEECDFSPIELAQQVEARVVEGSEEQMAKQIFETGETHLVVLGSSVGDLAQFASRFFYDYIYINESWHTALAFLKEKIGLVPVTDADLERISPEERGQFYSLMGKVSGILNDHRILFWAISGTLLGAIRHGGMVPWDDDLDIIVHVKHKRRLENLKSLLCAEGLELFTYHNYFYKIFPLDGRLIYTEDGSVYPWRYPFLDIFIINQLRDKIRIVSCNYPVIDLYPPVGDYSGWWLYPDEIRLPSLFAPFGPIHIRVPHDSQDILTREYGSDWRVAAYMWHHHATETTRRRIKVAITDYSPPEYVILN